MSYLHSIGLATGDAVDLAAAAGADDDPQTVRLLAADGFAQVTIAAQGVTVLAQRAMADSLARASIDPVDIDAVVFSTESFWDAGSEVPDRGGLEHLRLRDALLSVMFDLGLTRACPYGVWLSACGNLGTALGLANAAVITGQHRRVLLATADRQRPDLPRFMRGGAAILGDAAASCVIEASQRPGFRIEAVRSVGAPGVALLDPRKKFSQVVIETHQSVRRLDNEVVAAIGAPIRSADHVLAGHFHVDALKVVADTLKIPAARLRRDGRRAYGHLDASDNLFTLHAMEDEIAADELAILLNTGVWTWSAVALRRAR